MGNNSVDVLARMTRCGEDRDPALEGSFRAGRITENTEEISNNAVIIEISDADRWSGL